MRGLRKDSGGNVAVDSSENTGEGEVESSQGEISEEPDDDNIRRSDSRHNMGLGGTIVNDKQSVASSSQ